MDSFTPSNPVGDPLLGAKFERILDQMGKINRRLNNLETVTNNIIRNQGGRVTSASSSSIYPDTDFISAPLNSDFAKKRTQLDSDEILARKLQQELNKQSSSGADFVTPGNPDLKQCPYCQKFVVQFGKHVETCYDSYKH